MSQQPKPAQLPPWAKALLGRALKPGPIIGAIVAGAVLYLPSHSVGTSVGTALMSFIAIGGLRAADPYLAGLWRFIGQIPTQIRYAAGIGLPLLYSRSQFTPSASGQEISKARTSLIISAVIAYVFMRPKRGAPAKTP